MKYGFIGCGNMGGALARALGAVTRDMMLTDRSGRARALASELGCVYGDIHTAAERCDRLFLGVKPQMMAGVLAEIAPELRQRKPRLNSMAAGLTMAQIAGMVGAPLPVIRIMPNTPVAVGKGLTLCCANEWVPEAELADFREDMRHSGRIEMVEERLIDPAGTVSGCAPAYVYMFLEAMADGAVACGVPREQALRYAAAAVSGAAEMVLATGDHPGALKDAVCSPGGSTIAGVRVLEQKGFRGAVMDCIIAAANKNRELGDQKFQAGKEPV